MPRPTRRLLQFNEKSVNDLLQEIYNDSHNIKAKIARLFTKWEKHAKEGGEIAAIGESIVKLLLAEAKNQDQKLVLLRYLKEVVFDRDKAQSKKEKDEDQDVTPQKRKDLIRMVEEELEKRGNKE